MKIRTEGLQNWEEEQAHFASGNHHSTELCLMQFLHYQTMCMSSCPQQSREALDRAQQKSPHSRHAAIHHRFHELPELVPLHKEKLQIPDFFPALY